MRPLDMARDAIPTWFFALVVVRRAHRFLLVHERKHGQLWYLPGGRVEPGETLADAAVRETMEESGIPIRLVGLLRFEHTPTSSGSRVRAIFVAEPTDDRPPKSVPDADSLEAKWVSLAELDSYALRGAEVKELFSYVESGGHVHPLSVLEREF